MLHKICVKDHNPEAEVLRASIVPGTQQSLGTWVGSLLVGRRRLGRAGVAWALTFFLGRARWAVLDLELGTASWHGQLLGQRSQGLEPMGKLSGRSAAREGEELALA